MSTTQPAIAEVLLRTTGGSLSKSFVPDKAAFYARITAALEQRTPRPPRQPFTQNHY